VKNFEVCCIADKQYAFPGPVTIARWDELGYQSVGVVRYRGRAMWGSPWFRAITPSKVVGMLP